MVVFLIGVGITLAIGADAPGPPAYLEHATYIKSTMCKMCHSPVYKAWLETTHAKFNAKLPWEGSETTPPVEEVYRHVTGYNPATKTWSEKGITCEACHGPGSEHFKAPMAEKGKFIVNPAKLATPAQKVSICGRCHGQYTIDGQHAALNYKAGQNLLATEGFKLEPVDLGKPMDEMNEFVTSKHYASGKVTCNTCHTAHTAGAQEHMLKKPIVELCMGCHTDKVMAKHAPNAPAGATCATCHMPKGVHTFTKPLQ